VRSRCRALLVLAAALPALAEQRQILWSPDLAVPLTTAPAPAPQLPFTFVEEDLSGRSPKLTVQDAAGGKWAVKFGPEVNVESFATRLARALGYYSDVTWHLPQGTIAGVTDLKRAAQFLDAGGNFRDARFEYRDPSCRLMTNANWTWDNNPFLGTREFNGLRILMMLLSNWDHKDARDPDSNTAILECTSGGERRLYYYISDWGGSMGKWGRKFIHTKWDCEGFAAQSRSFVKDVDGSRVKFGFSSGRGSGDLRDNITVEDVRWFLDRMQPVTDAAIREALRASGATEDEVNCFAQALATRIAALQKAAGRDAIVTYRREN
jgi:hypothetical protein